MMNNIKLGVEVASAHGLVAKDGQGSSSPFVELRFDGQRFRTTTKEKDLNPVWNETFYFTVSDPNNLINLTLDAYIYNNNNNDNKTGTAKSCLGKIHINGTSFVPYSDAVVFHYPLEKSTVFSRAKGELGLKVFLTDDPSVRSSTPLPGMESPVSVLAQPVRPRDSRRTFRHLPNQYPRQAQNEMRSDPPGPRIVQMNPGLSPLQQQPVDYQLKETSPFLGGGRIVGGRVIPGQRPAGTYDLVEQMHFLFVRVVKARDLPSKDVTGSLDPFVEVRVGNYRGVTRHFEKSQNPEWNAVFAFSRERIQSSVLEVVVKDKDLVKDDIVGIVRFDMNEVPTRVPPDSPLAPEWYHLEDKNGEKRKSGELMAAVWMGTQADEAYPDAWHSDAAGSVDSTYLRSKVYHSPRLWYLRVNVIEVQDLVLEDSARFPFVHAKVQVGNQLLKTKAVQASTMNAMWNEDLMFVVAEPFEDHVIISVEDRVGQNKDEVLARVIVPVNSVARRADDKAIPSRWFNLHKPGSSGDDVAGASELKKREKFASRVHLRISLDGGYHVLDESTQYSSDLRPTAKPLWKPSIGVLELGILNADGLQPMKTTDGKGTSDTFCVAKYGHKWVRTRTIMDSFNPKYNEQYTWEVYDPATVLTVGVFDNGHIKNKDMRIGKVRIRISTLETGRVYTHNYPLLVLHPSGVKKMGELHLAIRFSCTSMVNMMSLYSKPLLPKMHYSRPLTVNQLESLRYQAVSIVSARLGRAEPALRKEVVEYMTDAHSHLWSMRRSKANFFRLMTVFDGLFAAGRWFAGVCMWKNPITTVLVHVLYTILVCYPDLVLPTAFLYMFLIGIWNYWYRPRDPPHMNTRLSYADGANLDELDEEFDTFPTSRNSEVVRMRYDRLRSVAGRIQTVIGDVASQGERVQALLSWRDPRATAIFVGFCLVAAIVLYATPIQVVAVVAGAFVMRHPRFRHKMPAAPMNFFRRLPARTDSML